MAESKVCLACGGPVYSVDNRAVSPGPLGYEVVWLCRPCVLTISGGPTVEDIIFTEQLNKPKELHWI